jgi:PIN domain nuclease of toxin-antitoxin system
MGNIYKVWIKKLYLKGLTQEEFFEELENSYYICKKLDNVNMITSYKLPMYHRDSFARFLIWESIRNYFVLLSVDNT